MALAKLSIDLEAKLASFDADLKRAAASAEQTGSQFASAFGLAKSALAGFVGAFSVGTLVEFFKRTATGVDNLNDLADATGASVQNLSALEDVAARTGTGFDVVGDALIKLNKALGDAAPGSSQEAAFKAINLSVAELKTLDPVEALQRVARALGGFADDSSKARLEQELLGKSLRTIAPLLNDLAEAGQLNATVTEEQAKQAEIFSHQMSQLAKSTQDSARAIVGELLPGLNNMLALFIQLKTGPGLLASVLEAFKGNVFEDAAQGLAAYEAQLSQIDAQLGRLNKQRQDSRYSIAASADVEIAKLQKQRQEVEAFARAYRNVLNVSNGNSQLARDLGDPTQALKKSSVGDFKPDKEAEKAADQYRKLAEAIGMTAAATASELETGEKLSATAQNRVKVLQVLTSGQYAFTQAQRSSILAALDGATVLDTQNTLRKAEADILKMVTDLNRQQVQQLEQEVDSRNAITKTLEQQIEEYGKSADAVESLRIARLQEQAANEALVLSNAAAIGYSREETDARQLLLQALLRQIAAREKLAGLENTDRTDPLKGAKDALDDYIKRVADIGTDTRSAVGRGLSMLEEDITRSLATGKGGIKEFVDYAKSEFIRLNLVRPAIAAISSGGGDLLKSFAAAFGFKGLFANGGTLGAGNWGIAGEAGPELVRGPATIQPLGGAGRASIDASVTIGSIGAGTSRAEVFAAVRAAQAQTIAQFRRMQMQGLA
jgi:hypothetical protein